MRPIESTDVNNFRKTSENQVPYEVIFDEISLLIAVISTEGTVLDANEAIVRLSGEKKEALLGQAYWELSCWIHSEEMQNRIMFAIEESAMSMDSVRFEARYKDFQGDINDVDLHIKAVFDELGEVKFFLASGYNVTELVRARRSLSDRERQMNALFEHSEDGYFFNVLPEGLQIQEGEVLREVINDSIRYQKIIRSNRAIRKILGYDPEQTLAYDRVYKLLDISGKTYRWCVETLMEKGEVKFEHQMTDVQGNHKILEIFMMNIWSGSYYFGNFGIIRDLTRQRTYEAELEFFANKDSLTGMNNRRTFFNGARALFNKQNPKGVVCMFDIDHFKRVNDTYGHDMGDEVLRQFGRLIENEFTDGVLTCRYGGEEFAGIFKGLDIEETYRWVERFRARAAELLFDDAKGNRFQITVSIGLSVIESWDTAVDQTISRADQALYQAKNNGRNQTAIFKS